MLVTPGVTVQLRPHSLPGVSGSQLTQVKGPRARRKLRWPDYSLLSLTSINRQSFPDAILSMLALGHIATDVT